MEKLLSRAMNDRIPVEIIYMSSRQTFTKRTILVRAVLSNHMIAYCFLRKQYRRFKLENILSALPVKITS